MKINKINVLFILFMTSIFSLVSCNSIWENKYYTKEEQKILKAYLKTKEENHLNDRLAYLGINSYIGNYSGYDIYTIHSDYTHDIPNYAITPMHKYKGVSINYSFENVPYGFKDNQLYKFITLVRDDIFTKEQVQEISDKITESGENYTFEFDYYASELNKEVKDEIVSNFKSENKPHCEIFSYYGEYNSYKVVEINQGYENCKRKVIKISNQRFIVNCNRNLYVFNFEKDNQIINLKDAYKKRLINKKHLNEIAKKHNDKYSFLWLNM